MTIDPIEWLSIANERRPKLPQTTEWLDGAVAPAHKGWYERHFTDSMIIRADASMQYWDGMQWAHDVGAKPHWRQVGDYPAWRGLADPQLN